MNLESLVLLLLFFVLAGIFSVQSVLRRQRYDLRVLDLKLDALLKHHGVEWSSLSPEVQALALDPGRKIAAIKRYREENPGTGLAEAKTAVEAFGAKKR